MYADRQVVSRVEVVCVILVYYGMTLSYSLKFALK